MIRFCRKYIAKYRKKLLLYLSISIVSICISVIIPVFWGKIIDLMTTSQNVGALLRIGSFVLGLGLANVFIGYCNNKLYIIIQTNSAVDMSGDIIQHLHKVSLSELQKYDMGYLNESINHDSNSITMFYLSLIVNAISYGLMLIFSLGILYTISIKIGIILLVLIGIYMIFYLCFRNKLVDRAETFNNARSSFFGALLEQFKNIKFIKQHALEDLYKDKLRQAFSIFFKVALNVQQFFFLYSSVDNILEIIINFCIYIFGGINVMKGNVTIGGFTIILNFYGNILSSVKYFSNLGKEYQDNNASYKRLNNYWNLSEQPNGEELLDEIETISCNNLSFSRNEHKIFREFNVTFKKGEIYCIQGENGSGKTTLVDLITGLFIGEYEGEIAYNGINIEKIDMKRMRQQKISVLEQNPYLLEGSPKDNIRLTPYHCKTEYDDKLIKKSVGNIGNNGEGISGGEKQKIGILRALAKQSNVLIFDEPTSALDQETRREFFDLLKKIKREKIIIFISHDKENYQVADQTINLSEYHFS